MVKQVWRSRAPVLENLNWKGLHQQQFTQGGKNESFCFSYSAEFKNLIFLGASCLTNITLPLSKARVIFEIPARYTSEAVCLPCFTEVSNVTYQISSVWNHCCVIHCFSPALHWRYWQTLYRCDNGNCECYCNNVFIEVRCNLKHQVPSSKPTAMHSVRK